MKILTIALVAVLLYLEACAPTAETGGGSQGGQIPTGDNSRTSLDWPGIYTGSLPCADCEGIQITLQIEHNLSYILRRKYIGKSDSVYASGGTFRWNEEGNEITLISPEKDPTHTTYFVGENTLTQLDANGEKIQGALGEKYILRKR